MNISRGLVGAAAVAVSIGASVAVADGHGMKHAGKNVDFELNGTAYESYFVVGDNKDAPLVYLIHDWDGLTEYEVKRSEMLHELGYSVFAVDLFGKGVRPTEAADKKQHTGELYKDREKMRAIMQAGLAKAKELGADTSNAVAMGYCFGGAAVLELARSGTELKGFASFHGGLTTPEGQGYSNTKGSVLVMHGTADSIIPMSDFANLADELEAAKVDHEMVTYGGAPHAFTVFGSEKYQERADIQSWTLFTDFLKMETM
ncbi:MULTISPECIES: dienelactone hydrolase family protein [unclassified Oleiphilus]|uniref:dienelactone hydrolase family protein n=1 Tax=unclassified Oleiphilus TaxID=2631174 RepID=UPI000AF7F4E9|nr:MULTISPECIES: dienelactone hydrolase family protein [unclassified Oleiphilus]